MKVNNKAEPLHSEEYIDDSRLAWWNDDYLDLVMERIGFRDMASVADIGTGAGHWVALLARKADRKLDIALVDAEARWLERARRMPWGGHNVRTVVSDAHALDLPDGAFDLVTCQTLLLHCRDPGKALAEMVRIARPGGQLLLAEPVNLINRVQFYDIARYLDAAGAADVVRLWHLYHAGQRKLEGWDHDIALRLPEMMRRAGLEDVEARLNDRVDLPQGGGFEGMLREYMKPEVEKFVLAAGGGREDIERGLAAFRTLAARAGEDGGLALAPVGTFLFSGVKPRD